MNQTIPVMTPVLRLWERLIEPHPSIEHGYLRRQVRLILSISAFFLLLTLTAAVVIFVMISQSFEYRLLFAAPLIAAAGLTIGALWLGHSDRPLRAISPLMLTASVVAFGSILVTPEPADAVKYAALVVVSTLIGAVFLSPEQTGRVAIATTVGLALVLAIYEPVARLLFESSDMDAELGSISPFVIVVTLLMVIALNGTVRFFVGLRFQLEADRIAEQKRAIEQEQLALAYKRSDEVKSTFLASMSHELRTPLNAIINFTRFVAKGSQGPVNAEQKETLEEVIDSGRHLLNLINDVLDMSKIEAGSLRLFLENNVDLKPILDSVIANGRALTQDKDVTVNIDIEADLPALKADRQRLMQILLNIMSNACKFTERGEIVLRARREGASVVFSVADTGPGIAPDDREAVFTPFKQTQSGLRQAGGTGLGMPISLSLTEAHGGRLWMDSELGKGTTFHVSIPIAHSTHEMAALKLQEA